MMHTIRLRKFGLAPCVLDAKRDRILLRSEAGMGMERDDDVAYVHSRDMSRVSSSARRDASCRYDSAFCWCVHAMSCMYISSVMFCDLVSVCLMQLV